MNNHRASTTIIRTRTRRITTAALLLLAAPWAAVPACTAQKPITTPMLDTRNPQIKVSRRVEAAKMAWESSFGDPETHRKARAVFKSLVWSTQTPRPLRLELVDKLLLDDTPEGLADSRRFTVLRLPTEPERAVVGMMALAAARNGWTETAPSLIRRLAEPIRGIPDQDRVEAQALRSLMPGRSLERIVFETFVNPETTDAPSGLNWAARVRADAWALLSRLDPGGDTRRSLIHDPGAAALGGAGPLLRDLRAAVDDLGVVPDSAAELEWIRALRDGSDPKNRVWWNESASVVAGLGDAQREGLRLRHIEPVRLAAHKAPRLLAASRDDLAAMLAARLKGRPHHRRTAELDGIRREISERLDAWVDVMSWGDLLAVLMIDDAVRSPGVAPALFQQTALDRQDQQTEYGGVIEAVSDPEGRPGAYRVVLFPPRPRDRVNDERFVASHDMVRYADRALAQYHLHVQHPRNTKYAGPSGGDLRNARLSGRNSVVFTSLSETRLGVDYYQPDGVVLDLGEISR